MSVIVIYMHKSYRSKKFEEDETYFYENITADKIFEQEMTSLNNDPNASRIKPKIAANDRIRISYEDIDGYWRIYIFETDVLEKIVKEIDKAKKCAPRQTTKEEEMI